MSEPQTLLDVFALWCGASPEPSLIDARGGRHDALPAAAASARVAGCGQGLSRLGVNRGDRVALLCGNRPDWHVVDFAVQHLGAVLVPIYPTLPAPQVGVILADSGAVAAVVEDAEQLAKVLEVRGSCPQLHHVAVIDGPAPAGVLSVAELVTPLGAAEAQAWLEAGRELVQPGDLATLIYTSGTTGEPKGVMLTHDNLVFNAVDASSLMPWPAGELALAFLPLSHVLERTIDYAYFLWGLSIAYCGILESAETMRRIQPQVFTAVPRFFEKVRDRMYHEVQHASGIRGAIARSGLRVALESQAGERRGIAYRVFDRLLYTKLRAALGGRIRMCVSGGAPLSAEVCAFFHSIGIMLLEGYGLTETSPAIALSSIDRWRLGSVGQPLPHVEVRIAQDGEILTRGRHVMQGYWNKPDETAAVLDPDGWLATGDIGELDPDGFLRVTDRKKELLVTAGGKKVAPQPIEGRLMASPLVDNAVLFGDRRPYIVALLVPGLDALGAWLADRGLGGGEVRDQLDRPEVLQLFGSVVDGVNAGVARFESIKKFRLLREPFGIATGELTPTLKVKRRVVAQKMAGLLDEMYREGADHEG
jgi:long-chain acyl-CoA synthetase